MDIVAFHVHHLPLKSCMQGTLKRSLFPFLYITFHVVNALCSKHKLVALNVLLVAVCHILVPWMLVGTAQCHQCWPCHHHSEPKVGEMNECFSCKLKKKNPVNQTGSRSNYHKKQSLSPCLAKYPTCVARYCKWLCIVYSWILLSQKCLCQTPQESKYVLIFQLVLLLLWLNG